MVSNADYYGRIKLRLFQSYFDFKRRVCFAQGGSGFSQILAPNGKFQQVNGLTDTPTLQIELLCCWRV
jgi:hypothetical protein